MLVFANAVAIFLQSVSARLGIATGADLATLLGARLSRPARFAFWSVTEIGILATEVAEFLGAVAGIHLLFGVGLPVAVPVAAGLVIGTLALGARQRRMEYVIFGLLAVVTGGYIVELWLSGPGPTCWAG